MAGFDWAALLAGVGKEHVSEKIETGISKLPIKELLSNKSILAQIALMYAKMDPSVRSLGTNAVAQALKQDRRIPRVIRVALPEFLRALPPGIERALEDKNLDPGKLETELVKAWEASDVKKELEDPNGAWTGPNELDHIHIHGNCHASNDVPKNAFQGSIERLLDTYSHRSPCPLCFGEAFASGWITVRAGEVMEDPDLASIITQKQAGALGMIEAILDLRRREVIERPDGINQLTIAMRKGIVHHVKAIKLLPKKIDKKDEAMKAIKALRDARAGGMVDQDELARAERIIKVFDDAENDLALAQADANNRKSKLASAARTVRDARRKHATGLLRKVDPKAVETEEKASQDALKEHNTALAVLTMAQSALDTQDASTIRWARYTKAQADRNGTFDASTLDAHKQVIYDQLAAFQPYLTTLRTIGADEFDWMEKYVVGAVDIIDDRVTDAQRATLRRVFDSFVDGDLPQRTFALMQLVLTRVLWIAFGAYAISGAAWITLLIGAIVTFVPAVAILFIIGPLVRFGMETDLWKMWMKIGTDQTNWWPTYCSFVMGLSYVLMFVGAVLALAARLFAPLWDKINAFMFGIVRLADPRETNKPIGGAVKLAMEFMHEKGWIKSDALPGSKPPDENELPFFAGTGIVWNIAALIVGVLGIVQFILTFFTPKVAIFTGSMVAATVMLILLRAEVTRKWKSRLKDRLDRDANAMVDMLDFLGLTAAAIALIGGVLGTAYFGTVGWALYQKTLMGIMVGALLFIGCAVLLVTMRSFEEKRQRMRKNLATFSAVLLIMCFSCISFAGWSGISWAHNEWKGDKSPANGQTTSGETKEAIACRTFPDLCE
ncbi:MAG: hypothetical protein ABIA47_04045 [bacterium]